MKGIFCLLPVALLLTAYCCAQTVPLHEPDYNKPTLFSRLPDTIKTTTTLLSHICESANQSDVAANVGNGFAITGRVTSTARFALRQTAIIAASNYAGAVVSLSRLTSPTGETVFKGRIFSFASIDAYELKGSGENYQWVKTSLYRIVNE